MPSPTTERIIEILRSIEPGTIASYGGVARAAGLANGARMVTRVLHSQAASLNLPWFRVVKKNGCIALQRGSGFEEQVLLLEEEGVQVDSNGFIDIQRFKGDFF